MAGPPWTDHRTPITPDEYEKQVASLLRALAADLEGFRIEHQERVITPDGDFRIDVTARFTQMGVDFLILAECKDHARPVEREEVQVLADKVRAANAQKGILFSTNGFQRGAIKYAASRRIALVRFVEGTLLYETKAWRAPDAPRPVPPPWANLPAFSFIVISQEFDGRFASSVAGTDRLDPLRDFVVGAA